MSAPGRRTRGPVAHLSGNAAEESVAADCAAKGHTIAERRWRSPPGEIDLILRKGETIALVEVKRARIFESAATRIGRGS